MFRSFGEMNVIANEIFSHYATKASSLDSYLSLWQYYFSFVALFGLPPTNAEIVAVFGAEEVKRTALDSDFTKAHVPSSSFLRHKNEKEDLQRITLATATSTLLFPITKLTNESNLLSRDVFLKRMHDKVPTYASMIHSSVWDLFDSLDRKHKGYISLQDLEDAMEERHRNGRVGRVSARDILLSVDLDRDGRILFDDFKRIMLMSVSRVH